MTETIEVKVAEVSPELLDELREANEDYHRALIQFTDANEISKELRKVLEGTQENLNAASDRIVNASRPLPLYDTTKT